MDKRYLFIVFRFLIVISILVISFYVFKVMLSYLYPFFIAFFLAILLNPIVSYVEKKGRLSRTLSTLVTIILFIVIFIFATFFAGIYIFEETLIILQLLPNYINELLSFGEKFINQVISFFNDHILSIFNTLPKTQQTVIMKYVNELLTQFSNGSTQFFNSVMLNLTNTLTSLSYIITVTLFIVISLFFMTKDFNYIKKIIDKYSPTFLSKHFRNVILHFKKAFYGFIKAQIIITFTTALIMFVCLILFKIEHALTISLFAFFIDFIPYAGIGIIFIPWIVYSFFISHYTLTIQLTLLYMFLIVMRQLLEPKILASSIGINPLIALIVLFISIKKWSMFGLIISPFILMLISTINHSGVVRTVWNYIKEG